MFDNRKTKYLIPQLFPLFRFVPQRMNTYIQFKSNKKDECIKINDDHEDHDCADRSIYFIIGSELIYPDRENKCQQDHQSGRKGSAR